jgi:hypothetical protein
MARCTGIGGVFIHAREPQVLAAWYTENFGVQFVENDPGKLFELYQPL